MFQMHIAVIQFEENLKSVIFISFISFRLVYLFRIKTMDLNDFTKLINKNNDKNSKKDCDTCTDFSDWLRQNMATKNDSNGNKKSTNDSGFIPSSKQQQQNTNKTDTQKLSERDQMTLAEQAYVGECPLQRDQFGRYAWGYLHTMAAYYPSNPTDRQKTDMSSFVRTFAEFFPCEECKEDFKTEYVLFMFIQGLLCHCTRRTGSNYLVPVKN